MRAPGKIELMSSDMISIFRNTVKSYAICICMRAHYATCQRDNECEEATMQKKKKTYENWVVSFWEDKG